ncbi:hypothetical protein AcV7_007309 [Taiwanofungus camphoratus]|nr:hypothetical protein AcW2_005523 [Antrodia cinnamomea]KAI0953914.1 hypothetical protein AcV7_007309 [Antrodia cinnamomea]
MLGVCTGLSTLHLDWVQTSIDPDENPITSVTVDPTAKIKIDTLAWVHSSQILLDWSLEGPFELSLRKLEITWDPHPTMRAMTSKLMKACRQSLEHLVVHAVAGLKPFENLSCYNKLASIRLVLFQVSPSSWVPTTLSLVHSTHLQRNQPFTGAGRSGG